jgi:2-keto-4-pentenoate hydratase
MLNEAEIRAASDLIWQCWREGRRVPALPGDIRPGTRAEGYAIQALLVRRSAQPLVGWKIAATSAAGQRHIGVDGPLAGRLLAEQVVPDGATISLGANLMRVAEPEFAFRMARALPPRTVPYTAPEVVDAVGALHVAIEMPDSRFNDFAAVGEAQLIADNACAHQWVLGPKVQADWRAMDLAAHRVIGTVASRLQREGLGANVLGDPRLALTWIANELSQQGITLTAGQVVTTGTCMVPMEVAPGDAMVADFGLFGRMSLRFVG